jgi:tRNA uridine 5-carbamoylmethylation protein Kti12
MPKIVLIDGLSTTGKSTTSYNLAKKLPKWIFVDIWRTKDMFESIGYSASLNKKEADALMKISKEETIRLAREIIRKTQRNILMQEATLSLIKRKLGKDLKKYGYKIYNVQLVIPLSEMKKRDKKRGKPTLNLADYWTEKKYTDKLERKNKGADVVVDTTKNSEKKVVEIILKAIGEKAKKHPYEKRIRRFW